MVNNSLTVIIGGSATVREDEFVKIDCQPLIEVVTNLTGVIPRVVWAKDNNTLANQSHHMNIFISEDKRFLIITATKLRRGGELGTSGNYTCRVCAVDSNIDCITNASVQIVCGKSFV